MCVTPRIWKAKLFRINIIELLVTSFGVTEKLAASTESMRQSTEFSTFENGKKSDENLPKLGSKSLSTNLMVSTEV